MIRDRDMIVKMLFEKKPEGQFEHFDITMLSEIYDASRTCPI